MIDTCITLLLEASAHEILARPTWSLLGPPVAEQHAAAAGYLAWRKVRETQATMTGAVLGPILVAAMARAYAGV